MTGQETEEQENKGEEGADASLPASGGKPLATAFLAGLLAVSGADARQPNVRQQDPPPAPVTVQDQTPQEKERRDGIRNVLLEQARRNFGDIAPLAATGYTQDLRDLQGSINGYLSRHGYEAYDGRTAIVLSPDEFDAARALGMSRTDAVKEMLARQGVNADAAALNDIARGMGSLRDSPAGSKFGVYTHTQDAKVRGNAGRGANGENFYVMVPMSGNISPNQVPGLSYTENLDFINKHEGWHIQDSRYDLRRFDKRVLEAAAVGWAPEYLAATPAAQDAFATISRKEALADVAALGDMIREKNLNSYRLITKVSAWRESHADEDDAHISSPVLRGMRQEIEKMGHGNFLRMTEKQAREFYYGVVEKYGLNQETVRLAAEYDNASKPERQHIRDAAGSDPEMKKALEFLQLKNRRAEAAAPMTATDEKIQRQLDAYQPLQELLDTAYAREGKITPKTLIGAHRQLEEELRKKAVADPGNQLYPLQMAKLQQSFVNNVPYMDYVAANTRRGVRIEEVEPGLEKFQPQLATASPAPKKGQKPSPPG